MTCKEQVKILDDKTEANKKQCNLDRMNAEISAYSSGKLPKYEKVKFEYSPIGKVFTDGLAKEDKSEKVGLFKRLKNIEDNLVEVDDNDNKVSIFRIIKDIKDRGIKIDNDDEAVREIRERIKELIDDGVKVNNFNEMKEEIMEHIENLKAQGINVMADEDQINDLINKISVKKYERNKYIDFEIDRFLDKYEYTNICVRYNKNKNKFNAEEITKLLKKLRNELINLANLMKSIINLWMMWQNLNIVNPEKNQVVFLQTKNKMIRYAKSLKDIVDFYNPKPGNVTSKKGEGLKMLTNKQVFIRLPILLAQIEAGNNSNKLKK